MQEAVWQIIGGGSNGGILVRESETLSSNPLADRLATGSIVEEVELKGERLHYMLCSGSGPYQGWVSVVLKGKKLAIRASRQQRGGGVVEEDSTSRLGPSPSIESTEVPKDQAEPSSIRVCAVSISGKSVTVNLARDCTVGDLKKRLVKNWMYPAECLKIILEGASLNDDEQLSIFCGENDPTLSITVVVSLDELYTSLEKNGLPGIKVIALRKLAKLVPHGCEKTISTMSMCLESRVPSVRREAVQALLQVAGVERAKAEVEARFDHQDTNVRLNAMECWPSLLAQDAERGNSIVSTMSELSEDWNPNVRQVATDMIKEVLFKQKSLTGDAYLSDLAQKHLKKHSLSLNSLLWVDLLWVNVEAADGLRADGLSVFIDAREAEDWNLSRIPGALSLPGKEKVLSPFQQLMQEKSECCFIVYSNEGSRVSSCGIVAQHLRQPSNEYRVLRLIGGLNLWKQSGLPVDGDRYSMHDDHAVGATLGWGFN